MRELSRVGVIAAVLATITANVGFGAQSCATSAASTDNLGQVGISPSTMGYRSCISADGRFVAFSSLSRLVAMDTDIEWDVYVRDRFVAQTELVSLSSTGAKSNAYCSAGDLTPDGRFVSFTTRANNLVANDTNDWEDVFVRDRATATTTRISVSSSGQEGSGQSFGGTLSADGNYVAFWSNSPNLVQGDTNGTFDIFVHDRAQAATSRVSVDANGAQANDGSSQAIISADGRWVAYYSIATNLSTCTPHAGDGFLYDRITANVECVNFNSSGVVGNAVAIPWGLSADGRFVAFSSTASNLVANDTNNRHDIFVRDRVLGLTDRVSVASNGAEADLDSYNARISANGRFIAFESSASNLVAGDTAGWDIFVHDRALHTTTLVSQSSSGVKGNAQSLRPSISPDGTVIAFRSDANNLFSPDTNGFTTDVIVRECPPAAPLAYCAPKTSSIGCVPAIGSTGVASSTQGSAFDISAAGIINKRFGLLLYGVTGQAMLPFQGGLLCVAAPLVRTGLQNSNGSQSATWDCSGHFHFDFNAWIQSGQDPALVSGQQVWTQYWYRDSGFVPPNAVGLTDALEFTIQ